MHTSIHKYPLQLTDYQVLTLPQGCRVMSVANQHERLCLWAWVPVGEEAAARDPTDWEVYIIGTGNDADVLQVFQGLSYLGTVLMAGGDLVWHVFVRPLRKSPE